MANKDMERLVISGLDANNYILTPDTTLSKEGVPADAGAVGDALEEVSEDTDALKEDLSTLNTEGTVPTSEQMLSDNYTVDSVPYHFRRTASDNADREELEIVGGSVAWNQRILTRVTADATGTTCGVDITCRTDGSIVLNNTVTTDGWLSSISGTNAYLPMVKKNGTKGHVLMYSFASKHSFLGRQIGDSNGGYNCNNNFNAVITKRSAEAGETDAVIQIRLISGDAFNNDVVYPTMFDLTAMFGSTIADHIYSLEQATTGAGVALFKSLFPKDYYAYDAGSMQSVSGLSEHKTVGFNAIDADKITHGHVIPNNAESSYPYVEWAHTDYIPVLPNTDYYYSVDWYAGTYTMHIYDANKNRIKQDANSTHIYTMPSNAAFVRLNMHEADVDAACFNLSDPAKNGTYEPYDGHSYALDDSLTLRGIPTLADGKIKWDGDVYTTDGKVTRRFGIVDLGTLNWEAWTSGSDTDIFKVANFMPSAKAKRINNVGVAANAFLPGYTSIAQMSTSADNMTFILNVAAHGYNTFAVKNTAYNSNISAFKAAMSGVYMVYELETPTTEQADPYVSPQICHYDGTEEFVSTGIVPVGHNTKYPDNLRMKLDNLPWNFASLIAPTESAFKATRNYTTGALLIVNNVLYKATANIANGGTITPNTNVTATTLAEVISALS